jgi:hypothetical protein
VAGLLGDPAYLQSVLAGLPGVDPNDPALQATLRNLQVRGVLAFSIAMRCSRSVCHTK